MSNQYKGVRLHVCRLNLRKKINFIVFIFLEQYFKDRKKSWKKVNAFFFYFKVTLPPPPPSLSFHWGALFCVNDASRKCHKRTAAFIWFVGKFCKYIFYKLAGILLVCIYSLHNLCMFSERFLWLLFRHITGSLCGCQTSPCMSCK